MWGYVWSGDTRLVDMHVRRLRGKIGADAIETVRERGTSWCDGMSLRWRLALSFALLAGPWRPRSAWWCTS